MFLPWFHLVLHACLHMDFMFSLWIYVLSGVGTRVLVCSFQHDDEEHLMFLSLLSLSNLKSVLNGKSLLGIRIMMVRAAVLNA